MMQLGFLHFEVADLGAWERFAIEVLGLEVASRRADGAFTLRMDGHKQRLFISPGPADDLAGLGLELESQELDELRTGLRAAGIAVDEAPPDEREVARRFTLRDPAGVPLELCSGAARASTPFASARVPSGFIADELGLGHVVLSTNERAQSFDFYTKLLGFRLSDHVVTEIHGYKADLAFLHCNPRHHTIALGDRQPKRLHHFMLETRGFDDVGLAYDRALGHGVRIMNTLGRHPNDRMFSFYAATPSGFQFEYGWGARLVDDATWTPVVHDRISEWGHQPPGLLRGKR